MDLLLSYKTPWKQGLAVKAAFYDADEYSTDTTKIMAFTTFGF